MSAVCRFSTKFSSLIVGVLHCFDRIVFKAHLAMAAHVELERFVDYVLRMRRCQFMNELAPQWSERLVRHAQQFVRKAGRPYLYRCGSFKKAEETLSGERNGVRSRSCLFEVCVGGGG